MADDLREKVVTCIVDAMDEDGRVSAGYLADSILAIPEISEALRLKPISSGGKLGEKVR